MPLPTRPVEQSQPQFSANGAELSGAPVLVEPTQWRVPLLLSLAELLGMAVWFSASVVVPTLTTLWNLNDSARSWLTMSVQIGFVVGAFGSVLLNLADRVSARHLFAVSA